jgi:hypothetical protein
MQTINFTLARSQQIKEKVNLFIRPRLHPISPQYLRMPWITERRGAPERQPSCPLQVSVMFCSMTHSHCLDRTYWDSLLMLLLLPVARVKKIVNADEDVGACSNNAAFVIALATEMFIQYFAEQTHTVVKTERKPRRNIQYRDVGMSSAFLPCYFLLINFH